jgi:peroxiredoxin
VGDIFPPIRLAAEDGAPVSLHADEVAGNHIVLILCDIPNFQHGAGRLKQFAGAPAFGAGAGALVFGVTPRTPVENAAIRDELGLPFPVLADPERRIVAAFGTSAAGPTIVVVRPNLHVMTVIGPDEADPVAAALATIARDADNRRPRPGERHAPILMIPDVLSREDCRKLINIYTLQGNVMVEPGHGAQNMTGDYKMRIPDYGRQDRIDHWVINPETTRFIGDRLKARVFPEIEKAFHYRITRFERFRIGCYRGERGGEAHGHRDNTAPITAHRRFAVSVNLNSEQFEGGELRFPEYGGQLYGPATGEAIAFSSSILHEPLHVTAGTRFVLLSFLFGES